MERKKILVVDADSESLSITVEMVRRGGYDVVTAVDGLDALDKCSHDKPDLVILSAMLPKLHGFQVCKTLKLQDPGGKTPVFIYSGLYKSSLYKYQAIKEFLADEFLLKPFDAKTLLQKIRHSLEGKKNDLGPVITSAKQKLQGAKIPANRETRDGDGIENLLEKTLASLMDFDGLEDATKQDRSIDEAMLVSNLEDTLVDLMQIKDEPENKPVQQETVPVKINKLMNDLKKNEVVASKIEEPSIEKKPAKARKEKTDVRERNSTRNIGPTSSQHERNEKGRPSSDVPVPPRGLRAKRNLLAEVDDDDIDRIVDDALFFEDDDDELEEDVLRPAASSTSSKSTRTATEGAEDDFISGLDSFLVDQEESDRSFDKRSQGAAREAVLDSFFSDDDMPIGDNTSLAAESGTPFLPGMIESPGRDLDLAQLERRKKERTPERKIEPHGDDALSGIPLNESDSDIDIAESLIQTNADEDIRQLSRSEEEELTGSRNDTPNQVMMYQAAINESYEKNLNDLATDYHQESPLPLDREKEDESGGDDFALNQAVDISEADLIALSSEKLHEDSDFLAKIDIETPFDPEEEKTPLHQVVEGVGSSAPAGEDHIDYVESDADLMAALQTIDEAPPEEAPPFDDHQITLIPLSSEYADDEDEYGMAFGKYVLLEKIATGGMAEIFKAKQRGVEGFEKLVAIKRILPHLSDNKDFVSMFIDEGKIAAQLTHQNIAQIYELGEERGYYYIAMEFVNGRDLKTLVQRSRDRNFPLSIEHAVLITSKLCSGLDYAHRKKDFDNRQLDIVHRDISPQNVLISYEGEVKIIDFGIAKAAAKDHHTRAGALKGKILYMSPEQAWGKNIDRRSDIFSLGTLLYEMLTQKRLFLAQSEIQILQKVRESKIPPLREIRADIPEQLEAIVLKSLAKDPIDRYQAASEMQRDLDVFLYSRELRRSTFDLSTYMHLLFKEEIEQEFPDSADRFQEVEKFSHGKDVPFQPASPETSDIEEDTVATREANTLNANDKSYTERDSEDSNIEHLLEEIDSFSMLKMITHPLFIILLVLLLALLVFVFFWEPSTPVSSLLLDDPSHWSEKVLPVPQTIGSVNDMQITVLDNNSSAIS